MVTNRPRNLLVILCDQLRRDALSCYGDPNIDTPHIDRLAQRGVRFDCANSSYPICVPFRFSMMTGEYAHTRMVPGIEWRMSPAERTLADEFNERDYETIYVGKWHLYGNHLHMPGYGAERVNREPVPRQFQGRWKHWRGFELRNKPFDTCYFVDDDPTPRPIDGYQTDGLFDIAMDEMVAASVRRIERLRVCCRSSRRTRLMKRRRSWKRSGKGGRLRCRRTFSHRMSRRGRSISHGVAFTTP